MEEGRPVSNFLDLVGGEIYSIKSPATCLLPLVHQIAFLYKIELAWNTLPRQLLIRLIK